MYNECGGLKSALKRTKLLFDTVACSAQILLIAYKVLVTALLAAKQLFEKMQNCDPALLKTNLSNQLHFSTIRYFAATARGGALTLFALPKRVSRKGRVKTPAAPCRWSYQDCFESTIKLLYFYCRLRSASGFLTIFRLDTIPLRSETRLRRRRDSACSDRILFLAGRLVTKTLCTAGSAVTKNLLRGIDYHTGKKFVAL